MNDDGPRSGGDRLEALLGQLAEAQAIAHMGSWQWDAHTNVVAWSDELYRIYGLEPRSVAITFESFLARVHPEDRERIRREVGMAVERGGPFAYRERIVRPDGSIRHLDTIGHARRDAAGVVTGLLGTCRDVTDERARDELLRLHAQIVDNISIGFAVWKVDDPASVDSVRLVSFNPAAEQIAGAPLAPLVGRPFREVIPYAPGGKLESLIIEVARDGGAREATVEGSRDPRRPNRSVAFKAFALPGNQIGLAVEDITEPALARQMTQAEQRVFEMIAQDAPLDAILDTLARAIEQQSPPALASVLLLDPDRMCVRHAAGPSLPDAYNRALDGLAVGPSAGSSGTALYMKKPVIVTDIETDPLWADYRELAAAAGLRACWSMPILATDGRALGTFAVYYRAPRAPSERELALIHRATHIAGIAIERRHMEDELRALSGHLESAREEERTGIAREIHDELGQALTALKMDIAWVQRRARAGAIGAEASLEKMSDLMTRTDEIIDHVRRISSELRPGVLDDLGLLAAIEWQAEQYERRGDLTCVVFSNLEERDGVDKAIATAMFRIFQEALTNVVRHSGASHVELRLERSGAQLELDVKDDGKGIPMHALASPHSLGLVGMRERARRLGGAVSVATPPDGGTLVSVRIPLRQAAS